MENQEKEIGITIHYIDDETIDTGDIILQDSIPYVVGEGYDSVMDKICKKVPLMLRVALEQIKMGCVYRRSQNEEVATYYPKRTKPRIY
jgi:methionyl-tRNA formyltransferase